MSEYGWIPVTERLPEEYATVIVTTDTNMVEPAFMLPNKRWVDDELDGLGERVIAWMPFPEPYKGR